MSPVTSIIDSEGNWQREYHPRVPGGRPALRWVLYLQHTPDCLLQCVMTRDEGRYENVIAGKHPIPVGVSAYTRYVHDIAWQAHAVQWPPPISTVYIQC